MYWTWRVWARNAGMAEPMNVSSSPRPMMSGHSLRAPTSSAATRAIDLVDEVLQVADRAHGVDPVAVEHRDARGVIAAVLQLAQAFEQEVPGGLAPHVADDAAHGR